MLAPILARVKGLPAHPLCWNELKKGAAKTTLAAALGIAECLAHPGTWVDVAAVDRDQAGILLDFAAGFCLRTPGINSHARPLKEKIEFDNESVLQTMAADEPSAHGSGGRGRRYRVILDELSLWPDFGLCHALLASTGKVPDSQVVILSNPGSTRGGEVWRLRELARQGTAGWHLFAPEDEIKPSWITDAWRERMRQVLPGNLYDRFVLGRWSDGEDAFLTREQVLSCVDPAWHQQSGGTMPVYVACDLGLRKDRTAIAVVGWDGDKLALHSMDVMDPKQSGGEVVIEAVEQVLLRLAEAFPVRKVLLDPWQLASSRQRLQARLPIEDFPYVVSNQEKVSKTLFSLIGQGKLRLYPDPALIDELSCLRSVVTPKGFRFDHRRGGHNDRAVALGMACLAACEDGQPSSRRIICAVGSGVRASAGGVGSRFAVGLGRRSSADDGEDPRMRLIHDDEQPRRRWFDR
jgi:phage terminase large subunit-like protein